MTAEQAIGVIRAAGRVWLVGSEVRCRVPVHRSTILTTALETLFRERSSVVAFLAAEQHCNIAGRIATGKPGGIGTGFETNRCPEVELVKLREALEIVKAAGVRLPSDSNGCRVAVVHRSLDSPRLRHALETLGYYLPIVFTD